MFDTMKLSTRLAAGFGVLLLLLAAVVGMASWQMHSLAGNTEAFADNIVPSLQEQNTIGLSLAAIRRWEMRHVLSDSAGEMETIESEIDKERKTLYGAIDRYAKDMLVDDEDRRHLEATRTAVGAYLVSWEGLRTISRKTASDPNAEKEVKAALLAGLKVYQTAQREVDEWWKFNIVLSERAKKDSQATYTSGKLTMFALAAVAFVLGITAALMITRSVLRQIGGEPDYAKEVVGEIAKGNLAVQVTLRSGDTESLLAAMQAMRDRLCEVVAQVRNSSDSIATGSAQIATGNADLSQRTEEQASNLQQTAASMEQLSSTVKTNADTTQRANVLAAQASAAAVKGGETVGTVVATMQDIAASSKKIADIISVIDGIAFQTNILALNAAVEAARAGEQGRGFAVVASEVRSLAGRSADAAKEIKSLIGTSVEKVEVGARQVNEAGASMDEIVAQVKRVTQLISEISNATAEQTSGISQVGDAVTQLDQVTQQNAALVEESAAAAESLRHQAAQLAEIVSVFKIG
jgi:methyl-accepting chemotaxis protein